MRVPSPDVNFGASIDLWEYGGQLRAEDRLAW